MDSITQELYDVAVIGAGMIGSSAAKYLATHGEKVALIGPKEDQKTALNCHGAYFDEGRIIRINHSGKHWSRLCLASVNRFRDIEKASGIEFYKEVGFVDIVVERSTKDMDSANQKAQRAAELGIHCELMQGREAHKKLFPFMELPQDAVSHYQAKCGGYISPRKFIEAQLKIGLATGNMDHLCDKLIGMTRLEDGTVEVMLELKGGFIRARKVLIATGAYANYTPGIQQFFPSGKEMNLSLWTQTIAYIPVSESSPLLKTDTPVPSMVTYYPHGELVGTYVLPPIRYPSDGRIYVKLGHHTRFESSVNSREELESWYRDHPEGLPEAVAALNAYIRDTFPDLQNEPAALGGGCVTATTPGKPAPFIDEISENVFVAVGGCGYAAKCCDELGNLATFLVLGRRDEEALQKLEDDIKVKWRDIV